MSPTCVESICAMSKVGSSAVPSKVRVFVWRLMHEKLATREALSRRGLIGVERESSCSFCFKGVELCKHMFFERNSGLRIGIQGPLETDSCINFLKFGELIRRKKLKEKYIIWLATVWCIWLHRNKIMRRY